MFVGSGGMPGVEDGKELGKSLGTKDGASLCKMLGLEDVTVSMGLEDGTILGKTEDGASLGIRLVLGDGTVFVGSGGMLGLEDGKALGKSLGREVDTSLGKRLGLEAGTVFVGLEDGVKARLLATEDSCEVLGRRSGGMLGLEDGKVLNRSHWV